MNGRRESNARSRGTETSDALGSRRLHLLAPAQLADDRLPKLVARRSGPNNPKPPRFRSQLRATHSADAVLPHAAQAFRRARRAHRSTAPMRAILADVRRVLLSARRNGASAPRTTRRRRPSGSGSPPPGSAESALAGGAWARCARRSPGRRTRSRAALLARGVRGARREVVGLRAVAARLKRSTICPSAGAVLSTVSAMFLAACSSTTVTLGSVATDAHDAKCRFASALASVPPASSPKTSARSCRTVVGAAASDARSAAKSGEPTAEASIVESDRFHFAWAASQTSRTERWARP